MSLTADHLRCVVCSVPQGHGLNADLLSDRRSERGIGQYGQPTHEFELALGERKVPAKKGRFDDKPKTTLALAEKQASWAESLMLSF